MMRFSQCEMGPSPLLIYEVYIVCSRPLIPDTASEMMFTKCAVAQMKFTNVQPAPFKD